VTAETLPAPAPYPRIPHLVAGRGTDDDRVLETSEVEALLASPVVVEEKLDGANVMLWLSGHQVEVSLRSGPGATDRASQLGPLRAWVAQHDELRSLLACGRGGARAAYGEWLYLTHSVPYDRLPAHLVVLDLLGHDGSFLALDERNDRCGRAGLAVPPELSREDGATVEGVEARLGTSTFGPSPMEGVVVRALDGGSRVRVAKLLAPGFERITDAAWDRGRPRNQLADREASWH